MSFDNGNNYNEVIARLYLRKTFDWFTPVVLRPTPTLRSRGATSRRTALSNPDDEPDPGASRRHHRRDWVVHCLADNSMV